MSTRTRARGFSVEELEELDALPVLKRRHPSRYQVGDWTPEMRRQIQAAPAETPCMSEYCE
jgi:hypothetical protein